jgi:hypothetical protein
MRQFFATIAILAMSFLVSACGVKDNNDGAGSQNPDLNLSPFEQLTGQWNGLYQAIENGKPFGDAVEAILTLESNSSFLLSLKNPDTASATGEWSEFQGRSLIFKISGSTIPRIGSSGKLIETTYELLDSSLRVATENFELKLTRKSETPGDTPDGSTPNPRILGNWTCRTAAGRATNMVIYNNGKFSLTSRAAGERVFLAAGTYLIPGGSSSTVNLIPHEVTDPLPRGSYFQFTQNQGDNRLWLKSMSPDQDKDLGPCDYVIN